jgi:hypothetical protein
MGGRRGKGEKVIRRADAHSYCERTDPPPQDDRRLACIMIVFYDCVLRLCFTNVHYATGWSNSETQWHLGMGSGLSTTETGRRSGGQTQDLVRRALRASGRSSFADTWIASQTTSGTFDDVREPRARIGFRHAGEDGEPNRGIDDDANGGREDRARIATRFAHGVRRA